MVLGQSLKLSAIITLSILSIAFLPSQIYASGGASYHSTPFVHGQKYDMNVTTNAVSLVFTNNVDTSGHPNSTWVGFTVTGTGSGFADVSICKTAGAFPLGQISKQKVNLYLNSSGSWTPTPFSFGFVNETNTNIPRCVWINFTMQFDPDQALISLAVPLQAPSFGDLLPIIVVSTLLIAGYALTKQRKLRQA